MNPHILDLSTIFDIIYLASIVVTALFVWFETTAFEEYAKILGGSKFFLIEDYEKKKELDPELTYLYYLSLNHNSFLTRMITCVYCLGFWMTVVFCLLAKSFVLIPTCYIFSLLVYKSLTFNKN